MLRWTLGFIVGCATVWGLTPDELTLLQDPGGWEYQTIAEANNGFKTQMSCFVTEFIGQCRGNLLFRPDNTFTQNISANGRSMHRGGRYQVDGNEVTFWDEHDTQDGPYTVSLNPAAKTLRIETVQAGVKVQMDLLVESEFRKKLREKKK